MDKKEVTSEFAFFSNEYVQFDYNLINFVLNTEISFVHVQKITLSCISNCNALFYNEKICLIILDKNWKF